KAATRRPVGWLASDSPRKLQRPLCKGIMFNVARHLKAPQKTDSAQWKRVQFLIEHGFLFQKIRPEPNSYEAVPYPGTLEDAKEFVVKYKSWAITDAL